MMDVLSLIVVGAFKVRLMLGIGASTDLIRRSSELCRAQVLFLAEERRGHMTR
jgi:hypothetical protein